MNRTPRRFAGWPRDYVAIRFDDPKLLTWDHRKGPSTPTVTTNQTLRVGRPRDAVMLLTLNRPEHLNAVPFDLVDDLPEAFDQIVMTVIRKGAST